MWADSPFLCCAFRAGAWAAILMLIPVVAGTQPLRLTPAGSESFGAAVSASGGRIAVGAPQEGAGAGAVYVYAYDPALGWLQEARLAGTQGEALGASVALEGHYLLAGAPLGGTGGTTYLFRRDAAAWDLEDQLEAPAPGQGDAFGASVALFSVYAFVGAPRRTASAANAGAVYVFENTGQGSWRFEQEITTLDGGSWFGSAIALESEYAVIGAPRADEPRGQAAGKAFIYARTGGSDWVARAELTAGDARAESAFGAAVSIDWHDVTGEYTILVGAPSAGPERAGAAYLFRIRGGLWSQLARYAPAMRMSGDRIGYSLLVDQDNILVGMPGKDSGAGAAVALTVDTTLYTWQEDAWQEAPQRQSGAGFGYGVATSERHVVIGGPEEVRADSLTGAAYVYTRPVALVREPFEVGMDQGLSSFPNPFRDTVTITVHGTYAAAPVVEVYDALGRRVAELRPAAKSGWNREVVWKPREALPRGVYGVLVRGSAGAKLHLMTRTR